jgi:TIR domain-containing protein
MAHWTFLSYARDDSRNDPWIRKFADDLREALRVLLGPHHEPLFYDSETITAGSRWREVLAEGLCQSRVCVALCSISYVSSAFAGKEYQVFLDRIATHKQQNGAAPNVLFPIVWAPSLIDPFPPAIKDIQFTDASLPQSYVERGLLGLLKNERFKADYIDFVDRLANKLVVAGMSPMQPLAQLPDFSQIPHAFLPKPGQSAPKAESGPHHAHFVYLSSKGWNWQPYGDDEIGIMAQRISTNLRLRYHDLDATSNLTSEIDKAETNNEPVMLIADASSMPLKPYSDVLSAYDEAKNFLNCSVLVPWPPHEKADLALLRRLCRRKLMVGPPAHYWDGIASHEELAKTLETRLTELCMGILEAGAPTRKAESAELSADAPLSKPTVTGPVAA